MLSNITTTAEAFNYIYVDNFLLWRAPQQMLRTHSSLEAYCAILWWRWLVFFSFFRVTEHRWNETDRGKPTYSGKNLSQCHFVYVDNLIYIFRAVALHMFLVPIIAQQIFLLLHVSASRLSHHRGVTFHRHEQRIVMLMNVNMYINYLLQ
jgi:hypothetical protein